MPSLAFLPMAFGAAPLVLGTAAAVQGGAVLNADSLVPIGAAAGIIMAVACGAWRVASSMTASGAALRADLHSLGGSVDRLREDVRELHDALDENIRRSEFENWVRIAKARGVDLPTLEEK